MQLRALEREAKAQRDLLESYLAKYREATARDSLGAAPGDARIISRAVVSNTPYFPKKLPIVLIATLATLFISAGFITTGELLGGNVYRGAPVAEPVAVEPRFDAAPAPVVAAGAGRADRAGSACAEATLAAVILARQEAPGRNAGTKRAAEPAPMRSRACARPDGLTVADLAQGVREAGEVGKRVAVVGAARRHRHHDDRGRAARAISRATRASCWSISRSTGRSLRRITHRSAHAGHRRSGARHGLVRPDHHARPLLARSGGPGRPGRHGRRRRASARSG